MLLAGCAKGDKGTVGENGCCATGLTAEGSGQKGCERQRPKGCLVGGSVELSRRELLGFAKGKKGPLGTMQW